MNMVKSCADAFVTPHVEPGLLRCSGRPPHCAAVAVAAAPWRDVIDNYVDDDCGLAVRKGMKDTKLKTTQQKVAAFQSLTGMDRATFYRRRRDIEEYMPPCKPPCILLTRTAPPEEKRPADGAVPGQEDAE
jgi:hypothetical protein